MSRWRAQRMLLCLVMIGVTSAAEPVLVAFTQFYLDPERSPTVVIYDDGTVISSHAQWGRLPLPDYYIRPASYCTGAIPGELFQEYLSAIDEALAQPIRVEATAGSAHDMRLTIQRYRSGSVEVSRGAWHDGLSGEPASDPWFLAAWALVDSARRYAEAPFTGETVRLHAYEPERGSVRGVRRRVRVDDVAWTQCYGGSWCADVSSERWAAAGNPYAVRSGDMLLNVSALPVLPGEGVWRHRDTE